MLISLTFFPAGNLHHRLLRRDDQSEDSESTREWVVFRYEQKASRLL
jgi:hypothetical protein